MRSAVVRELSGVGGYTPSADPTRGDRARRRERREALERELAALLIGESPATRELRSLIVRFAPTPLAVLIQGPTGSGKELVARALHVASGRSGSFVAFNVCAVAETMFEDALFGHTKGAFTGAYTETPGYLAEANGGTVFLDEISGLALTAQAKLLRAIETGVFRPVGASRDRRSDFRVVAASNEDLATLVRRGRFRRDLLQRLGGVTLEVSPLYQRPEDVASLARHFAAAWQRAGSAGVADGAVELLARQEWPGNVRELKHVVERAAVLADGAELGTEDVAAALAAEPAGEGRASGEGRGGHSAFARERLVRQLDAAGWNTAVVAAELGVNRATVYRRMQRLGIAKGRG